MDYKAADAGWQLKPLGGESGQAYMGMRGHERIFLKRNATPLLTALAKEGITPKLLWTKRAANGDVLSAQEWVVAQPLSADEMTDEGIIHLVQYVHQSQHLKTLFEKMHGAVQQPADFVHDYHKGLQRDLQTHQFLTRVLHYLLEAMDVLPQVEPVLCHGDLTHRNFMVTEQGRLYLIDWENVRLADPLSDICALLCQYVPRAQWADILAQFGYRETANVWQRVEWYALVHCMQAVKRTHFSGSNYEMNRNILLIKELYEQRGQYN